MFYFTHELGYPLLLNFLRPKLSAQYTDHNTHKFEWSSFLLACSNLKKKKKTTFNFQEKLNILQNYFKYLLASGGKKALIYTPTRL